MAEGKPPFSLTRCLGRTGWRMLSAREEEVNAPLWFGLRELTTIAGLSPGGFVRVAYKRPAAECGTYLLI